MLPTAHFIWISGGRGGRGRWPFTSSKKTAVSGRGRWPFTFGRPVAEWPWPLAVAVVAVTAGRDGPQP